MPNEDVQKMMRLQQTIATQKREIAEADGAIAQLHKQLVEHDCKTVAAAEKKLDKLDKEADKLQAQIDKQLQEVAEMLK